MAQDGDAGNNGPGGSISEGVMKGNGANQA
jgi:hypothetical protein